MIITRLDPFTGNTNQMDLPITDEQWKNYTERGMLVQRAFPHLNADEREFIMTGITAESWNETFPKSPEEPECWLDE